MTNKDTMCLYHEAMLTFLTHSLPLHFLRKLLEIDRQIFNDVTTVQIPVVKVQILKVSIATDIASPLYVGQYINGIRCVKCRLQYHSFSWRILNQKVAQTA